LTVRGAELEARLGAPPKTPDNSSLPPSRGKKPNRPEKSKRPGPRPGSLGRMGGGRALTVTPDEIVSARPARCTHCQAALDEADQVLHGRYDKIDLPQVASVVTRVERYAGRCRCCGGTTLAPVRRCRRAWSRARRSAWASWRWRCICVSCTRSATNG